MAATGETRNSPTICTECRESIQGGTFFILGAVLIYFSGGVLWDSTAKKSSGIYFQILWPSQNLITLTLTEAFNCIHATFQIYSFDVNFHNVKCIILKSISFQKYPDRAATWTMLLNNETFGLFNLEPNFVCSAIIRENDYGKIKFLLQGVSLQNVK